MPKFTYEDTRTGKMFTLDRETEPSESDLTQLFLSQQSAEKPPEQPAIKPAAIPDSAMQFLGNPQAKAPVPAASLEVMNGGFPSVPKAPLPPRPTQTDAIRKSLELTGNGVFGFPTVSQITQVYFHMQSDYERAIKPVTKSERDKAFEIYYKAFQSENDRNPNDIETRDLFERAATVGTRPLSTGGIVAGEDGAFVGVYFTDNRTGDVMVKPAEGKLRPIKKGETPTTPGAANIHLSLPEFKKMNDEVLEDEGSLRALSKYNKTVSSIKQGYEQLADSIGLSVNTLMSTPATRDQINTQLAKGQTQGLLAGITKTVGGGGVLTQKDIERMYIYLGGEVGLFQNREVVKEALANIYAEKVNRYNSNINVRNFAVSTFYGKPNTDGSVFFKVMTPMELDPSLSQGAYGVFGVPKSEQEIQDRIKVINQKLNKNKSP